MTYDNVVNRLESMNENLHMSFYHGEIRDGPIILKLHQPNRDRFMVEYNEKHGHQQYMTNLANDAVNKAINIVRERPGPIKISIDCINPCFHELIVAEPQFKIVPV